MLGGLEAYGSDDSDSEVARQPITRPQPPPEKLSLSQPAPEKSCLLLPPPKGSSKGKRAVFTVAKPVKSPSDDDEENNERPNKKPRLDSRVGAGSSSLLTMLPAPKRTLPVSAAPVRVLGGAAQGSGGAGIIMTPASDDHSEQEATTDYEAKSTTLVPPSLLPPSLSRNTKGKAASTVNSEAPPVNFFSLGTPPPRSTTFLPRDSSTSASSAVVSSAPTLPVFKPPSPSPTDPYPGYYQLPSGEWGAHDPEVYRKYYEQWLASQGLDSKTEKGFEGAESSETVDVDAQSQLDLYRKEREERKALTMKMKTGPAAPRMNIQPAKAGSIAHTRHQLSTLLTEAYANREALEEKIAQGKRNRKEAGNKYGF